MSDRNQTTQRPRAINSPPPPRPEIREPRSRPRIGLGVLVFLGTLLGSLLGIAADAGDAVDTVERLQSLFYPELCVAGSNTILGDGINLSGDWAQTFEEQENVRVRVDAVGSVRGVQDAVNGACVHVLAMSEPMTTPQYDALTNAGVSIDCAAEIGYDVIAFVTDIQNPTPALLSRQLGPILLGRVRDWSEVGSYDQPIHVLARPGSGTTEIVLNNVARWTDPNIADDVFFPPDTDYTPCSGNSDCLDKTLSTPGSLYWVSTAWMQTQPPQFIKVIPILRGDERPVNPLTQQVDLDQYPSALIRPLYLYVLGGSQINDETERLARAFLSYVRSVQGQVLLERYHFYTFFDRPNDVPVQLPPGFERGADGLAPVCRV
jgi:ABC-type phosphate transport system substrate-binding protein